MEQSIKQKQSYTHIIVKIAVLSSMSYVLYLLRFKLPFMFPSFLELQFSDLPALLGGFSMGIIPGCAIIVVRGLLKIVTQGTETIFAGDLADLIIGCTFVIVSSLIYKAHKTKKGALVSLSIASACVVVVSVVANRFILIPFYSANYGFGAVVGLLKALFPKINERNFYSYYLPLTVVPFNALRCLITASVCFFSYKYLSPVLHLETVPKTTAQ